MAAGRQRHSAERGCGATDRPRTQCGGTVFERHRPSGTGRNRGRERHRITIRTGVGRTRQRGCGAGLVHRLAHGAAGASGVVAITGIHGRDAVAANGQGRGAEGCRTITERCCTQCGGTVHEGHSARGTGYYRGGERHGVAIGAGVGGAGQCGCGARGVDRLADRAACAGGVVAISAVHGRYDMAAGC